MNAPPPHLLPEAKAIKMTVLKVKIFRLESFNGSKGVFVNAKRTKDKSHEGIPLLAVGLSLVKTGNKPIQVKTFAPLLAKMS